MQNIDKYTYLILNIIFIGLPTIIVIKKHYKDIHKYIKLIFFALFFSILGYFVVDPLATSWGAWNYHSNKTLGIFIGTSVVETLMWAIGIALIFAVLVVILAEKEEKKKPFWPLF